MTHTSIRRLLAIALASALILTAEESPPNL